MNFCTLFNRLYLPQGVALYRSLERTLTVEFVLHVLCMDEFSALALERLNLPRLRVVRLAEIENDSLRAARADRSIAEFCWTCTPVLMLHLLERLPARGTVVYVDADIRFFSDPKAVLDELGDNSIFIHEHDFAPEHAHFEPISGRFNVGVVVARNDIEGRVCLERWKTQCLAECKLDIESGKCGDQNYLNEWPDMYRHLVISSNPGVGLAPWNISKHRLTRKGAALLVDGRPVVFYHYHTFRLWRPWLGVKPALMSRGSYTFAADTVRMIYRPYILDLWRIVAELSAIGKPVLGDLEPMTIAGILKHYVQQRQLDVAVGDLFVTPV